MKAQTPAVTVLMAVYNGEQHLRPALESILGQRFTDFEFIVIDDGSTDSTRAIISSYDDARIRYFANDENLGLTRSLNRGLANARGLYVARQDADDLSAPDRLALQVAHLDRHPRIALLACAYCRIDDAGRVSAHRPVPLTATSIRWQLLFLNAFAHSSVTIRRDVALALGGYDEAIHYAQDYELWSRIAENKEVAALPQRLVSYRRSGTSMTSAQNERDGEEVAGISKRNVERVLPSVGQRLDREAALWLLFGTLRPVGTRRAVAASRDVITLQRAFARHYDLGRREAVSHRAAVVAAVTRGLRRAAAVSFAAPRGGRRHT